MSRCNQDVQQRVYWLNYLIIKNLVGHSGVSNFSGVFDSRITPEWIENY